MFIAIIPFQEYTRSRVVNSTKNYFVYFLITVALILSSIDYSNLMYYLSTGSSAFEYLAGTIYPLIIEGVLCTFLVKKGSCSIKYM